MSAPVISESECSACGVCVDACPEDVLELVGDVVAVVAEDACAACAACMEECPMGAIVEIAED